MMEIKDRQKLVAKQADISDSEFHRVRARQLSFRCSDLSGASFDDVNLTGLKIENANISDLEIDGAQIGGAYIHHIGLPPEGHSAYRPDQGKQRPVRFEDCELHGSTFTRCNLSNVDIRDCDISGLRINGVLIEELLAKAADRE